MKKQNDKKGRTGRLYFTGFSMGLADLVPGVSGGTIALLFGIYDELLFSIKQVTGTVLRLLLERRFKAACQAIPLAFLLPLFLGIGTAIFGLAWLVSYLLDHQPVYVWSLFFGLVPASAYIIAKRIQKWDASRVLLLVAGLAITWFVIGLSERQAAATPIALFLTGAVAFCAMILPGISGSLIMVILGQYEHVLDAVSNREIVLLLALAAGGVVGLAFFARLLSWLLKHHHGAMLAFLIGMMLGSLRKIWPWQSGGEHSSALVWPALGWPFMLSIALMALGAWLVLRLEQSGIAREHDDIGTKQFKKDHSHQENM